MNEIINENNLKINEKQRKQDEKKQLWSRVSFEPTIPLRETKVRFLHRALALAATEAFTLLYSSKCKL